MDKVTDSDTTPLSVEDKLTLVVEVLNNIKATHPKYRYYVCLYYMLLTEQHEAHYTPSNRL